MALALSIALRFRKGRRKNGLVSLISIISTLSIAIGIAALIVGLSAMNGFEKELNQRVLSVVPHGEFYASSGYLNEWHKIDEQLNQSSHITATMPFVRFTGLLENGNRLQTVLAQGIIPENMTDISQLPNYVPYQQWQYFIENSDSQIVIGANLAKELNVEQGNWVTLLIPLSNNNASTSQTLTLKPPKRVRLQVAGIFDMQGSVGGNVVLISLNKAQELLSLGDVVTGVMVNVDNVYRANYLISQTALNLDVFIPYTSWEYSYGYMYQNIQMIRQIMYIAMVVVIGIACFNIVSTLVIAVKDKQRDIAILKSFGAPNRLIKNIFICYGIISGLIGSLLGIGFGVIASLQLTHIVRLIEHIIGHQFLNSDIYFVDFLPSEIHLFNVVLVFVISMMLSLFASYYPASRACKLEPSKILSGY